MTTVVELGPALHKDGLSFRPPEGFHSIRLDAFRGTRVGVLVSGGSGLISSVLVDGDDDNAAALFLAIQDGSFTLGPQARDQFGAAVSKHLREELALDFSLERIGVKAGGAPRVELVGSIRAGSQLRKILVAGFPGGSKHAILVWSVPSGRWEEFLGGAQASMDTLTLEQHVTSVQESRWAWVTAAAVLLMALFWANLKRRRRSAPGA
jgi:hypothetical protein